MRLSTALTALGAVLAVVPLESGEAFRHARTPLLRMRVVLNTASPAADLTVDGGTIIHGSLLSDGGRIPMAIVQNRISFAWHEGGPTEMQASLLVSGVREGASLKWHLRETVPDPHAQLEVYNENDSRQPRLVDRFEAGRDKGPFETPVAPLLNDGPLNVSAGPRPFVLAFFYPWYQHFNWESDHLRDEPLFLYSTELPAEVAVSLAAARRAGLDGVVVSWRGDTDWNDRRLRYILDDAHRLGLTVSILVETLLATDFRPDGTKGPVADKMGVWLQKAVDVFGQHPAFMKVDGRPVIFVYVADTFTVDEWRSIVESLAGGGRNPLLMADSLDTRLLQSFNGEFTYATALIPPHDLQQFYSSQAIRTQSYNLSFGGGRRVAAATVSPGYDDTLLDRTTTFAVDRANGTVYEAQWQAALAAQPDWILVTTWNEFYENTYIEPSVKYGHYYGGRTRAWSQLFRH